MAILPIKPSSYFIDLPPELWTAIFLLMDGRTILRCSAVCHRFKDIIQASMELQYRIELVADGMVDGPPSSLTVGERLTRLRELRRSWATLQWSSKICVPMPGPCHAYELVGGVFCKMHHSAPQPFRARHLTAAWLPSALDPQGRTLVRENVGFPTRDFAVDPSQDLIIYFKGGEGNVFALELCVRTLSTNEAHPEARSPTLRASVLLPVSSAFMQIVDDIIGMWFLIEPERTHITLWNWKTGKVIVDQSTFCAPPKTWDVSFISSRAFFVTTAQKGGTIEIFTFDGDPTEPEGSSSHPLLLTRSSSAHESTASNFVTQPKSNVTHVASLHLPAILSHIRVVNFSTHTGPFLARPPSGRPFVAANEERTHVFSLHYVDPNPEAVRRQMRFCVFLKNSTLERYIRQHQNRSSAGEEGSSVPLAVPWEEWGRENTRFMVHHWSQLEWLRYVTFSITSCSCWSRYVHGHRVVLPAPATRNGKAMMCVLDFNVHRDVWRSRCCPPDDDAMDTPKATVISLDKPTTPTSQPTVPKHPRERYAISKHPCFITEPSVEDHPLFFPVPFETALPYRELWHEQEVEYSGIMVDEERIVCLQVSDIRFIGWRSVWLICSWTVDSLPLQTET
ncbi:hypothetical protein EDD17DRAFT_1490102 [Pisolithus thermaeus]|nr:hypothetical protein EDD17DRAFT_1490102 [Pisolithus thermaeus]